MQKKSKRFISQFGEFWIVEKSCPVTSLTANRGISKITVLANTVIFLTKTREEVKMPDKTITQEKILESAKTEFLEKGFLNASLRNIVKNAGVTTGAFYRYYDSKEALFEAIVGEHAQHVLALFCHTIDQFEELPGQEQTEQMLELSTDCMGEMLDYVYEHHDAFKLLVECADGTRYTDFIHKLVEKEVESTYFYIETLERMGHKMEPINKNLIHMIASGQFTGIFEVIVHDMPKEEAIEYATQMRRFYAAGWSELMNIQFGR